MDDNLARALRLMLVTDDALVVGRDLLAVCAAAVRGGVTSVQLRLKQVSARRLVELARDLRAHLSVPVLVNDRPDVALAAGCGVHVGGDDLPVSLTRRIMGPAAWVGASVGSELEAQLAGEASYWGVGPLHGTSTKADAGVALGLEGFRAMVALARGRPCVAIGGVRPEDVPRVLEAGGAGVAVVSGILGQGDVEAAARRYRA